MGLEDCMEVNVFHMRTQEGESNYQWAEVAYFLLNLPETNFSAIVKRNNKTKTKTKTVKI